MEVIGRFELGRGGTEVAVGAIGSHEDAQLRGHNTRDVGRDDVAQVGRVRSVHVVLERERVVVRNTEGGVTRQALKRADGRQEFAHLALERDDALGVTCHQSVWRRINFTWYSSSFL